jgi:hypothetical protein
MTRRIESREAAARRARVEFDSYGDSVWLSEHETAAVTGLSQHTLKGWRLAGSPKGPRASYVHNMVRYGAGEIRRWRAENSGPARLSKDFNCGRSMSRSARVTRT